MRKLLLLSALSILPALGQTYVATKTTTLNNAAEVITVQQPSTGARTVKFMGAWVDCSVACTVTLERNGTAATTTTLATAQTNPSVGVASSATAFSSSNVGVGTIIGAYQLSAASGIPISLNGINMTGNGIGKNLTIRTNSISGVVDIIITWQEETLP